MHRYGLIDLHKYVFGYVYIYIYIHMHTYVHTYIYIYIYTYVYIYKIYIYIYTAKLYFLERCKPFRQSLEIRHRGGWFLALV